ncbi:glycosyltransferase family 32 protein [Endozoicomonas euniceicola]|uniref:Uncharacterized protein n=1 Tax=Endozoicomonas euniceicola TaxID=1234143 RepID=A0ABY6GR30_9GAMM|nr:hypothetical protein [Endozoicomonas euniceicola]UYM14548.1 hypothetical protein NX720_16840 [Endozoicomonas euniceicola]
MDISGSVSSVNSSISFDSGEKNSELNIRIGSAETNNYLPSSSSSEEFIEHHTLSDFKISTGTVPNVETSIQAIEKLSNKLDGYINEKYKAMVEVDIFTLKRSGEITPWGKAMAKEYASKYIRENYHRLASEFIDTSNESKIVNQFLRAASDEDRVTFFSRALAESSVCTATVESFHNKMLSSDSEYKGDADYLSKAYQRLFSNKTGRKDIPEGGRVHDTVPVNFIWLGGLLPDRYLENIKSVASATPQREVVIWIDRKWMTRDEYSQMMALPELPELKGLKCKVLDINDAGLTGIIPNRQSEFEDALKFIREKCDNKAMASDLIRYALLAKGTKAIDKASHSKTKRATEGMIYMDTDRGPKSPTPSEWGDMEAPAGLLFPKYGNDVLATTFKEHPVFLSALNMAIDRLHKNKRQLTGDDPIRSVLDTTGPGLFSDAATQFTNCDTSYFFANHLELDSPVAGPPQGDKTWIPDAQKVDLSASWMSKLPEQRNQRNNSTRSCCLIS